jgi:RimJ/RimL family protein N-acetyltransferase
VSVSETTFGEDALLSIPLDETATLRPLEPWNAEEFDEFAEANRDFLGPWLPWVHVVVDVATSQQFLQRYAERQARDEGRIYGIWDSDHLVGGTLFRTFDTRNKTCEIGVWLSPDVTGRGLVTNAASHMIDWAVNDRGMVRVEWLCDVDNSASKAVAERLGMTREGVMRSLFVLGSHHVDAEVWSVLADEWLNRRTSR